MVLLAVVVVLLAGAKRRHVAVPPGNPYELRSERSFAITEKSVVAGFTFERVLATLIANSSAPAMTPEQLFRQMMDTQNPKPGLDASMPHCDDFISYGKPSLNGFPRRCPTFEGALATAPYNRELLFPVAVINRFDMADPNGANCGQYRLIFAKKKATDRGIMRLIFEGVLPNPTPAAGLAACRPVAQFWAGLSKVESLAERRSRLERFFFDGIAGFPAALRPEHLRDAPNGIRGFFNDARQNEGRFYQFRLVDGGGQLYAKPDVLENFVTSVFYDARNTSDRAVRFREVFLENIPNLAIRDVNAFHVRIPDEFLFAENNPMVPFFPGASMVGARNTEEGKAFEARIRAELAKLGSALTVAQVVNRAAAMSCDGCHTVSFNAGEGVQFPQAGFAFEHVSEELTEKGEAGDQSRFAISPAMRDVFVPNRMRILTEFLASGKAPTTSK